VPPLQFIPLLKRSVDPAGRSWALKRHRLITAVGQSRVSRPARAVNVSPIQMRQRNFVEVIKQAITDGLTPTAIDMEITESLIMEDIQGKHRKLNAVRAARRHIAIDDFGTGYSSLGYLAGCRAGAQIDRSFISAMNKDSNAMTLVSTIISLAHSLQLKVIAEGVETGGASEIPPPAEVRRDAGLSFSKPLPLDALCRCCGKHRSHQGRPLD